jgi:Regulator of chromosome condensation (RCC1) repeat
VLVSGLTDVVSIAPFQEQVCALLSSGKVACWGWNHHDQIGSGVPTNYETYVPVLVPGIEGAVELVGQHHQNCARLASGEVMCWGGAYDANLGDGKTWQSASPVLVAGITDAAQVVGNLAHNCVLHETGDISCWGGIFSAGAQNTTPSPVHPLPSEGRAVRLTAGWSHTCALSEDGAVACWNGIKVPYGDPALIEGIHDATSIAAGNDVTCVTHACGSVSCWDRPKNIPYAIAGIHDAIAVSGNTGRFCALRSDGAVSCWDKYEKTASAVPLP